MLISKVFAPTADGLRAIERNVVVGLARTVAHSARHADGTLFGNHFVVCFVLFIPVSTEAQRLWSHQLAVHARGGSPADVQPVLQPDG